MAVPAFSHQRETTDFILNHDRVLITSDPGTGKTRAVLDAFAELVKQNPDSRMLVLAPLSILQASWVEDIEKFTPHLTCVVAYSKNREKAFKESANIVITNHDAIKWLDKNKKYIDQFDTICIDEFTAYKNRTSQRSKAAGRVIKSFDRRIAMSGTPNGNTIRDIWHPTKLVDDGERLGPSFYPFQQQVCTPKLIQLGNRVVTEWLDKDNAEEMVAVQLQDITIRHKLEDCIDMPKQTVTMRKVTLPKRIQQQYETFAKDSVLYTGKATINAINAGVKVKKLLQLCTGAVYKDDGTSEGIHTERYDLVMELVKQRKHSLVAFNWKHERDHMIAIAEKEGIAYRVIDGDTPEEKRKKVVDELQLGELQVVFCHPQSAGHGLTMTKATSIIWCLPTYNAEHYLQFNRRIYRAGQTKRTEIIQIAANDTWEPEVYNKLGHKMNRMEELLSILKTTTEIKTNGK